MQCGITKILKRNRNICRRRDMAKRYKGKKKGRAECFPCGQVFLSEQAFINLVVAATEAYQKECYGVLLENGRLGRSYIHVAFAYQTARRTPSTVELVTGRWNTLRRVLQTFPKYDYIGEFHSHPDYGGRVGDTAISDSDLIGVREGECGLVIAIHRSLRMIPWLYCLDGTLLGVVAKHFIKMKAYLAEEIKDNRNRT